jgi:tRNA-splicing ligase RtcB (3'-phosphate/5'-hydroxy nucleic acid ligase)
MVWNGPLNKIGDFRFEIPSSYKGEHHNLSMKTSGIIYASDEMIQNIRKDNAPEQTANMTMLPGIVGKAMAMPDIHWGYGFPIGGVAATDVENGVISPGGVGFDINCLDGDALILHEHGYQMRIKDFEKTWMRDRIKCANFGQKIKNTDIHAFMKFKTRKNICEVVTQCGERIIATEDHPFYTPDGMVPLMDIEDNGLIAVFPFVGVNYSVPSDNIILTDEDIRKLPLKKDLSQTVYELKKRNLLPLRANDDALPYLLKLMGYVFGDGTLYFSGNKGTIWLYGDAEDLEEIRKDIDRIGFTASKVYHRERRHEVKTMYDTVRFDRVEHSIKITSSSLAALLWALGTPCGNKSMQDYLVPSWLLDLELWQKRLFLAAFFGAELSSPSTVTDHGYNFYSPILSMNKSENFVGNAHQFLLQIKDLLTEFDITSSIIRTRKEYVGKNNHVTYRLRLQISSAPDNLLHLWGKIGFEYNKERRHRANIALQYLMLKNKVLSERVQASEIAVQLKQSGVSLKDIVDRLSAPYVNKRFIERSLYGGRGTSPRIAHAFPGFWEFAKEKTKGLGDSGVLWDSIERQKVVRTQGDVYDFTVADSHHNFIANGFVVSNCGVRLVRTNLLRKDLDQNTIRQLVDTMFVNVPSGLGSKAKVRLQRGELEDVAMQGAQWAVDHGYGWSRDTEFLEEKGRLKYADIDHVSTMAKQRGAPQLGSLGAGNHFLEVQYVDEIFDPEIAKVYGITDVGQVCVMIHTGSRGFGHQICSDHLKVLEKAVRKYNIWLPDRQLACAPVTSKEGESYFKAMACAANFAWCNRQMIVHWVRESFEKVLRSSSEDLGMDIVYDVCHNIAKLEEHIVDGEKRRLCVHRKGATRAFGPGSTDLPLRYESVGQPVLIPGDMGTESYLLHGTKQSEETFGSTCHGAGRVMSRNEATRRYQGETIVKQLGERGIYVHPASMKVAAEEAPGSYKDIRMVVDAVHGAGISKKVVRLKPLGVVKG